MPYVSTTYSTRKVAFVLATGPTTPENLDLAGGLPRKSSFRPPRGPGFIFTRQPMTVVHERNILPKLNLRKNIHLKAGRGVI
jgi:hypothetical protein